MSMILTPKNWNSFQHYKDRSPAWIKLHRGLLDDYEFFCLPIASRALAPVLWLIASEYDGGKIDASLDKLAFRLRMTRGDLADALSPLIERGFFSASEPLAESERDACLEEEKEEEDIDKRERESRAIAQPPPKTRGTRLPVGWSPTAQDLALSCALLGDQRAHDELEKFADHWKAMPGARGVKLDWDATWRNWYKRAADFKPRNGNGPYGKPPSQIIQAINDVRRKVASFDGQPSEDINLRSGQGGAALRLLPDR